jgi:hypothetical protein
MGFLNFPDASGKFIFMTLNVRRNYMKYTAMDKWIDEIKEIMKVARNRVASEMNNVMLETYWHIGKSIVVNEQDGEIKAQYGERILLELSKRLTRDEF